ncbi:MAG: hypothetical protein ACJ79S_21635 [Gemmatimonadaceae bacterium]
MDAERTRPYRAINLAEKLGSIGEQWSPRVVAEREVELLPIEPRGTLHTRRAGGERTVPIGRGI